MTVLSRSKACGLLFALPGSAAGQFVVPDSVCTRLESQIVPDNGQDGAKFSNSLALDGNTLLVGAPLFDGPGPATNSGLTYVYRRGLDGSWTEEAQLSPAPVAPFGQLGLAVAIHGDVAVVGATDKAFVYERSGSAWSAPVLLVGSGMAAGERFGGAVAIEGDRIAIGANFDTENGSHSGSAFIFERIGGVWTETAKLFPDDAGLNQQFGASVALSEDRVLIGAWGAEGTATGQGAAYVFAFDSTIGWHQEQKLLSPSPAPVTLFGWSVDLDGDQAIVGNGREDFFGGAYVYEFDGALWQSQSVLESGSTNPPTAVAIDGDIAVVGLSEDLVDLIERPGLTVIYVQRDGVWESEVELLGTDIMGQAGTSVAIHGDTLAVGVPNADTGGDELGAAEVYALRPFVAPTTVTRNAGTNPFSYSAVPTAIGETLEMTVFAGSTGHTHALVIGFNAPAQVTLPSGQTLLCLDQGGGGEWINTGLMPGPIAHFSLPVPNTPSIAGLMVCTQALHAFGAVPFALSNAQDIVIGGCQ